jgi:hypothetical protein
VVAGPGDANPPLANTSAVAIILALGDRDSIDQVGAALQPQSKKRAQLIAGNIALSKKTLLESCPLIRFTTAPIEFKLQVIHQAVVLM